MHTIRPQHILARLPKEERESDPPKGKKRKQKGRLAYHLQAASSAWPLPERKYPKARGEGKGADRSSHILRRGQRALGFSLHYKWE